MRSRERHQRFLNENELVDFLVFHARLTGRRAYTRVKVPGSGLPDIDILYAGDELVGVEVKYFRDSQAGRFYLGLDEALALLLYGLDRVYLLHGYPERQDYTLKLVNRLPIGYMAYMGGREPEMLRAAPLNPLLGEEHVEANRRLLIEIIKKRYENQHY